MLAFIYNGKLRLVEPLAVKRGRFGSALLVAKTRDGKTKSFTMGSIVPLSKEQEEVLNGTTVMASSFAGIF